MCLFEQIDFKETLRHPDGVSRRERSQEQGLQIQKSQPGAKKRKPDHPIPAQGL